MKIFDRLMLSQINVPFGAVLRIVPLNNLEAQDLVATHGALTPSSQYTLDKIANELRISKVAPSIGLGEKVVVGEVLDYKTVRFFLVEVLADSEGVTRDGEVVFSEHYSSEEIPPQKTEAKTETPDPFEE